MNGQGRAQSKARAGLLREAWALWVSPLDDEHWQRRMLPGGLLLGLFPLLLPLLWALGYLVAAAQSPAGALPAWRPLSRRLQDGARLFAALFLYGLPGLLAFGTFVVGPLVTGGALSGLLASVAVQLAQALQPIGLAWLALLPPLAALVLGAVAQAPPGAALGASPRALWQLWWRSPAGWLRIWAMEVLLSGLGSTGLFIALVGWPFTAFWGLVALARAVAGVTSR
jgi:hypothetical protein